eukprot:CAMPEP_0195288988 /NCGR_PEP_ID=MMETSP0707-20130614/5445_1 /TAXON_ID=33640 /ORGANISM="Asterionellopsis glacialis, Strain CCMP134" /LENGTH=1193 /DNA_ID=CAMNT_0040348939 /DNA_START=96 /DNA_END=3677 /DNA_ORIENTATION=+
MMIGFTCVWSSVTVVTSAFATTGNNRNTHVNRFFVKPPFLGGSSHNNNKNNMIFKSTPTALETDVPPLTEPQKEQSSTTTTTTILANHEDFIRPDPDSRQYRAIRLANNLEVLLVSSPESDVEAGAVHVQAGHMDDPDDRAGLAHFHEHMLFLGTEKYPSEEEYEAFLSTHGGSSNAYTDMEDTNYYFSVTPHQGDDEDDNDNDNHEDDSPNKTSAGLTGALDRLAQFFIKPKFDVSMVERELRAIDSEYRNSLAADSWRNYQLLKFSANQEHPFSKFGCGNYNTLTNGGTIVDDTTTEGGTSPVDDLLWFWKTYYQTYNIKLCVVGRSSLDALQETVEETFGKLAYSEGTPRHKHLKEGQMFAMEHADYKQIPAFGTEQLQKIRQVVPLLETRALKIHFAAPPLDDPVLKSSRPYRLLSHLLGHESPGSLHEALNEEGLLVGLSSGIGIDASDFSLFSLTVSLTKKGMDQKDRVLDLVFEWIALISKTPHDVLEKYHQELCQISNTNFKFRENGDPTDFCSSASELLFQYKPEELLVGSSRTGEYDPKVFEAFMERLTPEHVMITELNSDLKVENPEEWLVEKWYGATYQESDIPQDVAQKWSSPPTIDSRLKLPALNEYIPTDFSLRCDDDENAMVVEEASADQKKKWAKESPKLVIERPDLRLWHKMDRTWRVPKTNIKLSLLSPNVYRSPRTMTMNRIFQRVLNDDLNSYVYDASIAGCNYRVMNLPTGYRISVSGYSEKLPFLLDTLTSRMLSLLDQMKEGPEAHPALADMFKKASDNLLRETKNFRLDSPYEIANYNSRLLMEEQVWHIDDYSNEMEGELAERDPLTMEECARVVEESLLGRVKAELLCMGNINEEEARKVVDVVDSHFLNPSRPLLESEKPVFRSMKLPTKEEAVQIFGPEVSDKSIPVIHQEVAYSDSEANNAVELILQVGSELELGIEGVAILDLISHMSYNSAYTQLRTKEQLGYIVSSFVRKTVGSTWGLSVVVQSSVALPETLEQRCEAWLELFRQELEEMDPNDLVMEANAVVAQLLERETKLAQEITRNWGAILMTEIYSPKLSTPAFDRVERVVAELLTTTKTSSTTAGDEDDDDTTVELSSEIQDIMVPRQTPEELKAKVLKFFDKHFAANSVHRRAMSARVYNHEGKAEFEKDVNKPGVLSTYADIQHVKQYLSTWPIVPYWRIED